MRYRVQITGAEGLIYDHMSRYLEGDCIENIKNFLEKNKEKLHSTMERDSIMSVTTMYDDGETETKDYYRQEFCLQFNVLDGRNL